MAQQEDKLTRYKQEQQILVGLDKYIHHDVVESIHIGNANVKLKFKDGIIINRNIIDYDPYTMWKYKVEEGREFPLKPLEKQNPNLDMFFCINYKHFMNSGMADKDIAIHKLIIKLLNSGWKHPLYPAKALRAEWDYLCNNLSCYDSCVYPTGLSRQPGFILQTNFYDFGSIKNPDSSKSFESVWKNANQLYFGIYHLINRKRDITLSNLIRKFSRSDIGRKFIPVGFYVNLFKNLNLKHKHVHDMTPYNWSKAIAASLIDIKYTYNIYNPYGDLYNQFLQEIGKKSNTSHVLFDNIDCDVLMFDDSTLSLNDIKSYLPMLGRRFKTLVTSAQSDDVSALHVPYIIGGEKCISMKIYK